MAAANFRDCLALVLAHEGGYVNHPADPGGATNFGVTQKVYDAYRDYNRSKHQSVRHILTSEVSDIYNKNYWRLVRGDNLPCGLDYAVFDFGVNSGVSRAVKFLQRVVHVLDDGVIGLVTLSAVEKAYVKDAEALIAQYCANRLVFLRALPTFPVFGKGWTRRVIGAKPGAQAADYGVIDYATGMAKKRPLTVMPDVVGSINDEVPGKAIAPIDTYTTAPPVHTVNDVKNLSLANDELAALIAAG